MAAADILTALWADDSSNPPALADVVTQVGHFLEQIGYAKTLGALRKEATKNGLDIDTTEWEKTGIPLLHLHRQWRQHSGSVALRLPVGGAAESDSDSDPDSDSSSDSSDGDASEEDEVEGALVDVEAEETSDDDSDEKSSDSDSDSDSSSSDSSDSAAKVGSKRKRVETPSSDSDSSFDSSSDSDSDSDSDSSGAPPAKKNKVSSDASSDSSSDSDSSSASDASTSDSDSSESDSDSSSDESPPPKKKQKKAPKVEKLAIPKIEAVKKDNGSQSSATLDGESPAPVEKEAESEEAGGNIHPDRLKQMPTTKKQTAAEKKKTQVPFSRIPTDQKVDPRFASNQYVSYDYADRAHQDLIVTKGKGFTKEKNKKKRGAYRGGAIDFTPKGIKFDD